MKKIGPTLSKIASLLGRWTAKPFIWFWQLFLNEWEVTIWYEPSKKTAYKFKYISKVDSKTLKGRLTSGEPFELKTQEPFNFQIKKVK